MDYDFRMSIFEQLHPEARIASSLPTLKREYTWDEIATVTRSGPASALGLLGRGTLQPGSLADLAVYRIDSDAEAMFGRPAMVFRRGKLVYRDGAFVDDCDKTTIVGSTYSGDAVEAWPTQANHRAEWISRYGYSPSRTAIRRDELMAEGRTVEENRTQSD